jgi:hypothetical protein
VAVEGVDMAEVLLLGRRGPGVESLLRSLGGRDGRRYIASAARLLAIRADGCAATTQGAQPWGVVVVVAQGSRRVQPCRCRLLGLPVVKGAGCWACSAALVCGAASVDGRRRVEQTMRESTGGTQTT